jgi:hypothetical protein
MTNLRETETVVIPRRVWVRLVVVLYVFAVAFWLECQRTDRGLHACADVAIEGCR